MRGEAFTPLGRKLVWAILGTTLLALALALALNFLFAIHAQQQDAARRAHSLTSLLATSLAAAVDFDDQAAARENLDSLALIPQVNGAAVYVNGNTLFAAYGEPPPPPRGTSPQNRIEVTFARLEVTQDVPSASPGSRLVLTVSLADQWAAIGRALLIALAILAVVFVICIRVAIRFRKQLTDPLAELGRTVADIARRRDYSRRAEYRSDDEIGMLVAGFNAMLERIENRDAELRRHREYLEQMVAERTRQLERNNFKLMAEMRRRTKAEMIREEVERINRHDLKSSLSLIIGYPELLLAEGGLTEPQARNIRRIRAAGYRMLDMIRNHLDMFKMEHNLYSLRRSPVDMVETLCSLEEEFSPLLGSSGVLLNMKIDGVEVVGLERFDILGEEPLLRAMLRNLIQNAIEASRKGDTVLVRLEDGPRRQVSVYNPTPVPPEVRHRIFEKYVTHGKENGTGLGTYFAALIARTHGANITMHTDNESGTLMTVTFRHHPETGTA
ncbi:HAMP domain-containing protein [Pseudodesulfovibrio sp. F-1]|uniref:histidine kinase n=1 Tax=Pseudodesulfovibrio alkaliphilus TaxID=2661613 RepID=A0A7K1KL14_9BACT|nr:ATP-binding protein [Pseudodesulfovibrio alkaliphilus]MUM76769.1 HAMP domain-containing protein [Pseudodesulfovibrio alkaliphilus]